MATVFRQSQRNRYYVRVTVPVSVRHYFASRAECWKSLGTKDKQLAKVKASVWNSRLQRLFYTLATRGNTMDKAQIEALVSRWMDMTPDLCEDYRAERLPDMTVDQVEDQWTGCSMAFDEAQGAMLNGDYKGIRKEVEGLLFSATLPALDPTSTDYARLARAFLQAKQRVYELEMERWDGDYKVGASSGSSSSPSPVPYTPATTPAAPTKLFSEVVELYLREYRTRSAKTQGSISSNFKTFLSTIGGDRPIGDITKADCRKYKEHLVSEGLKAASVNKYFKSISHFFKWCNGQGFVPDNFVDPGAGLQIAQSIAKKESLKRQAFTPDELLTLIRHPDFQKERTGHSERYWITMLCLYAGLRREEAAQLRVDQVVHDSASGVWYFDIVEGEGQSLKNEASRRRVPLHHDLTGPLGFLGYRNTVKKGRHARLFHQCHATQNGYGGVVGQWFAYFVRQKWKYPPSLVLHSLRHGFSTGLHATGKVPDQIVYALCGHTGTGGEVHLGYTHREVFPLKVLADAVNTLDFGLM